MSTWYAEQLRCPRCAHELEARLALGVHASRLPEVRAAILRGELHRVPCDACGAAIDVHRQVAYTDFDRKHWVHVARPTDLPAWAANERDARAIFERAFRNGAPAVADLEPSFTRRVVFDLDELRERLAIWDAGLDDAIVECVKLGCVRERPLLRGDGERIRLRGVGNDGSLQLARIRGLEPRLALATWTVPRAAVVAIAAARGDWRERYPELFAGGFVSIDRYFEATAG